MRTYPLSEAECDELIFIWACIEKLQTINVVFYALSGTQQQELSRLQARSREIISKVLAPPQTEEVFRKAA